MSISVIIEASKGWFVMAMEYTEEQLNNFDKSTLIQLFLVQQSQLKDIDAKLQLLLEQVAVLNNNRYGRSSEKLDTENQICFMEVDGNIVYFNEAEAVDALAESEADDEKTQNQDQRRPKAGALPISVIFRLFLWNTCCRKKN